MVQNVYANTKKAFSLVEFLVALIILSLISVALMNGVVFFTHKSIEQKVVYLTSKVPEILKTDRDKLNNCTDRDPCASFNNDCLNSLNCQHPDSCIVRIPENGKDYYFSISTFKIPDSDIYKVTTCAKIFGKTIKKEALVTTPYSLKNLGGNTASTQSKPKVNWPIPYSGKSLTVKLTLNLNDGQSVVINITKSPHSTGLSMSINLNGGSSMSLSIWGKNVEFSINSNALNIAFSWDGKKITANFDLDKVKDKIQSVNFQLIGDNNQELFSANSVDDLPTNQ